MSVVLSGRNFFVDRSAPLIDNGFVKERKMKNFQIKIANQIWSLKLRGQVQIVEFFKEKRVQTERKSGAGSENALIYTYTSENIKKVLLFLLIVVILFVVLLPICRFFVDNFDSIQIIYHILGHILQIYIYFSL